MIWQVWWAWLCVGLILGILEMLVPAYVFLGLAIGAGLIGLALLAGGLAWLAPGLAWLLVIWAVLSIAATVLLRRMLGAPRGAVKIWRRDIND